MKKTLAAVAVLGAFAGSSLAADVTLYGLVDEGFGYSHVDLDGYGEDRDTFSMESGQQSGSRFGLKGVEELGNGLKVGFVLENGFSADTGADSTNFFDRESSLFIEGGFGKVAVGHIGSFNQGQGTWSLIGRTTAFGTSFGTYVAQAGNIFASSTRYDNMIAYQTPSFAGFKVYAMYGMGTDGAENESGSDRYYGVAATYDNGPVALYAAVDSINYKSWNGKAVEDVDDSLTVTLGGSYDFEVAKVYLGAQYFDEVKCSTIGGLLGKTFKDDHYAGGFPTFGDTKLEGYSFALTGDMPLFGGKAMAGLAYVDAEPADSMEFDADITRYIVSAGYDYPFSKRTDVYGVMSYMNDKVESAGDEFNPSAYTFMVGLRHKF